MDETKAVESSATAPAAPSAPPPSEDPVARAESQTLNQILEETKEQRRRVIDLPSRLDLLAVDNDISDDIERDVTCIVFAPRLVELAEMKAAAEARVRSAEADLVLARSQVDSLVGEKDAAEKALDAAILERDAARRDLDEAKRQSEVREAVARKETDRLVFDLEQREETIRSLKADKAGMEETISSLEESLSNASDKLQSIAGEKTEAEKDLERAIGEREACKRDLDTVTAELQMATAELITSTEKMNSFSAECLVLKARIGEMQQEFDDVRSKFDGDMEAMKKTVRASQCKKEVPEEEKDAMEAKISISQETVAKLAATVQGKENLEEESRKADRALSVANQSLEFVIKEKDDVKIVLDQAILERELRQRKLAEEEEWKAMATKEIERLKAEYVSLEKSKMTLQNDNEKQKIDYARELDGLKVSLDKAIYEKESLCKLTDKQLFEITYLLGQVEYLLSAAVRLHAEKENVDKLKVRLKELEKKTNDAHRELQKIEAALNELVAENNSGNLDCDATMVMAADGSSQVVEEVEEKSIAVDMNSGEILSLLRSTSDSEAGINGVGEGHEDGAEQEIIVAEEEPSKSSAEVIQAREEEVQELRGAMEAASKKSATWPWVYPTAAVEAASKESATWPWFYPTAATTLAAIAWALASKR